jgi:hypothetical protein
MYSQLGTPIVLSGKLELSFYLDERIPSESYLSENKFSQGIPLSD